MARYTADSVERVRDAVDMVELVGKRTDLRRVGSRWVGLCPFHDERTPSFSVNAEEKLYHCFGCGVGGDAIAFVRETESVDFREAVELLAERYGVELRLEREDAQSEERRRRRERLLALLDRTARFYATFLWESSEAKRARAYLSGRGLEEETLREFRVGYAPSAWHRVTVGAQQDGFSPDELLAAGLAQPGRGGGLYDRFRGRIMFPLADARGRVLGFGARALAEGRGPKYLNTSENEIYHKGRQLFGIDRARAHASREARAVVVEGYTDVLALHQAGVPGSVGIMGTALTPEQLAELGRAVGRGGTLYLALDADRSGRDAMLRATRLAREQELELLVVEMPEGADPAELLAREGREGFLERVQKALSVLEFQLLRILADADLDTPAGRDRALEESRTLIALTRERPATREHLINVVADRIGMPPDFVGAQLTAAGPAPSVRREQAGTAVRELDPVAVERVALIACLASGSAGRSALAALTDEHFSSAHTRGAREHLGAHFDDPLAEPPGDPAVSKLVAAVAADAGEREPATEAELRLHFLALEHRRLERELQRAVRHEDLARQDELAATRQELRREMDTLTAQTA